MLELRASERMKECLEIRIALLHTNYAKKNEFEKNEIEILKLQTENKLQYLNTLIAQRNMDFELDYQEHLRSLEFDNK
jgi:hypothetical protein